MSRSSSFEVIIVPPIPHCTVVDRRQLVNFISFGFKQPNNWWSQSAKAAQVQANAALIR
jgi:hypothetical protein